jgi:hypothetical protein
MVHAPAAPRIVEAAHTTFRIYDGNQLLTEAPRTIAENLARFNFASQNQRDELDRNSRPARRPSGDGRSGPQSTRPIPRRRRSQPDAVCRGTSKCWASAVVPPSAR